MVNGTHPLYPIPPVFQWKKYPLPTLVAGDIARRSSIPATLSRKKLATVYAVSRRKNSFVVHPALEKRTRQAPTCAALPILTKMVPFRNWNRNKGGERQRGSAQTWFPAPLRALFPKVGKSRGSRPRFGLKTQGRKGVGTPGFLRDVSQNDRPLTSSSSTPLSRAKRRFRADLALFLARGGGGEEEVGKSHLSRYLNVL